MRDDFITSYLEYRKDTEPPKLFHRWSCLSMLGAYLGRDVGFQLGEFRIHPNMYTMLIGVPGTRKSTAIKLAKKLLARTGYATFSADKSSKEKWLMDLAGDTPSADALELLGEDPLFGGSSGIPSECYIACDEFNNFIGNGNIEFVSLLGELWDYEGPYKNRIKTGKSVVINNPTISILGGNTATGFALAFPSTTIGQGFFSRLLLVYSDPSPRKITFPESVSDDDTRLMVEQLLAIKRAATTTGISITSSARSLLDKIYHSPLRIHDIRFEHYANRRLTHLIKLALIAAASRVSTEITEEDVVVAHTILTHTEKLMPKALGEFGKGKNSDVAHKIISVLEGEYKVMGVLDIWKHVASDMEKMSDLTNVLQGLAGSDKILRCEGGFLAKRLHIEAEYSDSVDYSYLTEEEIGVSGTAKRPPKLEVV